MEIMRYHVARKQGFLLDLGDGLPATASPAQSYPGLVPSIAGVCGISPAHTLLFFFTLQTIFLSVSYTHLTLPTKRIV